MAWLAVAVVNVHSHTVGMVEEAAVDVHQAPANTLVPYLPGRR